jgi:non-specific serine/threonine protein kinase
LLGLGDANETPRFNMLEVIREYAAERLLRSEGEACVEQLRRRLAEWFASMADAAPEGLRGRDQLTWLRRLELEHDNVRSALGWSLEHHEPLLAGRVAAGLWPFWRARGYFHEGRRWLNAALSLGGELSTTNRADILNGAGVLALLQSDYAEALASLTESRERYEGIGDEAGAAFATSNLGWLARDCNHTARAHELFEQSLATRRTLADRWGEAHSLNNLGVVAIDRSDLLAARSYFEVSLGLFRQVGDAMGRHQALNNFGWVEQELGEYERARELYLESLTVARSLDDARGVANNLSNLALIALFTGDYGQATEWFEDSLAAYADLGDQRGVAGCLEGLAGVAGVLGRPVDAARRFGLAAALRASVGAPLLAADRSRYESTIAAAREQLDDATWARAWAEGQASSLEELDTLGS